jgi:hypothetical protein
MSEEKRINPQAMMIAQLDLMREQMKVLIELQRRTNYELAGFDDYITPTLNATTSDKELNCEPNFIVNAWFANDGPNDARIRFVEADKSKELTIKVGEAVDIPVKSFCKKIWYRTLSGSASLRTNIQLKRPFK